MDHFWLTELGTQVNVDSSSIFSFLPYVFILLQGKSFSTKSRRWNWGWIESAWWQLDLGEQMEWDMTPSNFFELDVFFYDQRSDKN